MLQNNRMMRDGKTVVAGTTCHGKNGLAGNAYRVPPRRKSLIRILFMAAH
jgi:hypothetical protein